MTRWIAATALAAALIPAASTTAHDSRHQCSTRTLAGRWLFATDVGQFPAFGGDITAMGTMNIARTGRGGSPGSAPSILIYRRPLARNVPASEGPGLVGAHALAASRLSDRPGRA